MGSPCSKAETRRVISDCEVGRASEESELTALAAKNVADPAWP